MRHVTKTRGAALALAGLMALVPLAGCASGSGAPEGEGAATQEQPAADGASSEGDASSQDGAATASAIPENAVISVDDLHSMLDAGDDVTVVDVRSRAGYTSMMIPGSKNLPAGQQFELRLREVPTDKPVVLIGSDTTDLAPEYNVLLQNGFSPDSIRVVEGGVQAWVKAGYPTESNSEYAC